ncbi:Parvovirus coat protein VP1 [Schinkia azotoformans MEV2011]|uniref:Parvovirus coat protein VP1 n=1 Tax=Schinkia azotoformans MEV2011 TaxID=1348973 RepID=A0A072NKF3_SCHAZ|nr:phospholipase A2 family enzyme [Schinkia azotoformans]KEF37951.1 Parvovirus coat protein VP1 [Schinkia azotoformans MEV2011]MEC1696309.1 phospholipase [Schinkia azotoformans]MEC1717412.1 phospholipase [Schinkia azotoformans]MEC1727267.1 phospholipase [Schinkia azotoformans]MEC1740158.1 phospholipase [Schinkia azotoformans]
MLQKRKSSLRFCIFPGYNWCGPGCSGPGAPINAVDAACRAHDLCYRRNRNPCECDREFMRRLERQINLRTEEARHARMLHQYMKLQSLFTCGFYRK